MSSRAPSPPYRGRRGGDAEDVVSSMERLSLRRRRRPRPRPRPRARPTPYSPERRAASSVSRDRPLSPPPPPPSDASVVSRGIGTPPQPQHKQESGSAVDSPHVITITATQENQKPVSRTSLPGLPPSMNINPEDIPRDWHSLSLTLPDASIVEEAESGSELDSPPYLTYTNIEKDPEPSAPTSPSWPPTFPSGSPTSPPASPPLVNVNPTRLPKYSSSDEEDPFFKSLVDNFATAAANTFNSTLSDDDIDYKAQVQQKCVLYAESALKHYNNDEKKEVKYELFSGIACSDMMDEKGCYGHVNFTAKGNQHNSKEELFFAELRWDGDTPVTTCVVSLEGEKNTGGLRDSKYDNFYLDVLPYDAKNCYACDRPIRHPKNGELYEMGHVAMSEHYIC